MINLSDITRALLIQFQNDVDLQDFIISRSEVVNENPGLAINGWLGIYRSSIVYDPFTIGISARTWLATLNIKLIIQAASNLTGADCEDQLEDYVKRVLDAVMNDTTINNQVDKVNGVSLLYTYLETDRASLHFHGALIELTAEVRTS